MPGVFLPILNFRAGVQVQCYLSTVKTSFTKARKEQGGHMLRNFFSFFFLSSFIYLWDKK